MMIQTPQADPSSSLQGPGLPRHEGSSLAVLLIWDGERSRVPRNYMERLGIRVWVGSEWAELPSILREAQQNLELSRHSSAEEPEACQHPDSLSKSASKNSSGDQDQIQPVHIRFLLLVINTSFGPVMELIRLLSEFRRGLQILQEECNLNFSDDVIISRPFHGTRLIKAIKLPPEFEGSSLVRNGSGKMKEIVGPDQTAAGESLARSVILDLGATVDVCDNGEEAVLIVSNKFSEQKTLAPGASSSSPALPYDFILMDCQMPITDGYEATQRIREEEKEYNTRIPIIAVTAHSEGPDMRMIIEAGKDSYLLKPHQKEALIRVLQERNIT
ncbi:hypothetical protein CRG98_035515 [Punica granatum]|uniref:Response regulatory domain-containing protein n=1 Tax=Punica granatum TaxID=22663 RepID=A0A2I0IK44_PUNGR|nr:hypothetical protein CRG98_035515 [Punica granatum]